ncbi:MAG TPA: hypothetical protein VNK67_15290 [Burkholderiales bacterium]|nr:hypothetical protein [Burkholderiales bacterium]
MKITTDSAEGFICVYLCVSVAELALGFHPRLSRSNVHFHGVWRTINHQEMAEAIGTGFICG